MAVRRFFALYFEALGFPAGTTAEDAVLFVHAVDNAEDFSCFVGTKFVNSDAVFSTTALKTGLPDTYKPCGAVINTNVSDVHLGFPFNFRSGNGKNSASFGTNFVREQGFYHEQYEYYVGLFKEVNFKSANGAILEDDYIRFVNEYEKDPNLAEFKLSNGETLKVQDMFRGVFAKLFASTVENKNIFGRGYTEFLVRSVQINAIFYQSKTFPTYEAFAAAHPEMIVYAKQNNLPIFVL